MSRVYLDWNATAPLRPEARTAMIAAMDVVGNPSSVHAEGREAKAIVERARGQVARAVGCTPPEVIFTSGATEAAQVLGRIAGEGAGRGAIFVDETSHDALWAQRDPAAVQNSAGAGSNVLAMGIANSETGLITEPPAPVDGVWPCGAHKAGMLLLDVTQAVGRIPWSFAWSGAQLAILSAHKLGGPKGVGALIVKQGIEVDPLLLGGGQEMGRRSGTENLAGIAGFGAAAEAAQRDLADGEWEKVAHLRNILEKHLEESAKDTIFVGKGAKRLPNTSCFAVPGWKGETQVVQMDLSGYAISAGSACSSGKVKTSRVLRAMGYDDVVAQSAIRVSLGPMTTQAQVLGFAETWLGAYRKHKARAA